MTTRLQSTTKLVQVAGEELCGSDIAVLGLPEELRRQHENYSNRSANPALKHALALQDASNATTTGSNGAKTTSTTTTLTDKPIIWGPNTPQSTIDNYQRNLTMERDLHFNVDAKSLILSRLMHEANQQAEELAKLAEEMVSLRDENQTLNAQATALGLSISQTRVVHANRRIDLQHRQKEAADRSTHTDNIEDKYHNQLEGIGAGILEMQLKRKNMLQKTKTLNDLMTRYPWLPGKKDWSTKMEQAIRIQMMYIERMKEANKEVVDLEERVQRTERVIHMMETKLYTISSTDESVLASMHPRVKYRIRDLQEQVMEASDRERALTMVLHGEDGHIVYTGLDKHGIPFDGSSLGSGGRVGRGSGGGSARMKRENPGPDPGPDGGGMGGGSTASVQQLKKRVATLETQMISNARGFAQELSTVKLDLMQAQMGGDSDSDDE